MMNLHRAIALQVSSLIDECFPRARHRIRAYYMHGSLSTRNGGSPKEGRFHDWRSPNKAKQASQKKQDSHSQRRDGDDEDE